MIIATGMGSSIILISPEQGTQAQRGEGCFITITATILTVLMVFNLKTKLTIKRTYCTANCFGRCPASTKDQRQKDQRHLKFLSVQQVFKFQISRS